ncbi:MAG: hypothetical protein L6264_08385 [Weeksellaceae bacterium]|nr:hypothetical protein [Bacteroidota bacterium]MCG2780954.1 hypothetical protein [Weeksellaceae bacterium]
MGKVHSIFKVSGKLGDYVFYQLNGKQVARKLAGKKRGPKSQAEKENEVRNVEFGKASSAGKFLRTALAEECRRMNDRYLYQKINKLMLKLKAADPAEPGQRTPGGGLGTPEGRAMMRDFRFQKKHGHFPKLNSAVRKKGKAVLHFSPSRQPIEGMTELQINLQNGDYRRHLHPAPEVSAQNLTDVPLNFRQKKGYTELLLIWGEGFLQGAVVTEDSELPHDDAHSKSGS